MVLLETNADTLALYYGGTVDPADGSIVIDPAATGGRKSFVSDLIDGTDAVRTYIPAGEILAIGDQVYQNGEPVGYDVTITAYADSTIGGSYVKFYSALVD